MLLLEHWKPVFGWEEHYEISNLGTIRRLKGGKGGRSGRKLKAHITKLGYWRLCLYRDNKPKYLLVHCLVAETFLGPRPDGMEVNHIDHKKSNPRLSNLEFLTPSGNLLHFFERAKREEEKVAHAARLVKSQVIEILKLKGTCSQSEIANRFGVIRQTISDIHRGKRWGWLKAQVLPDG